MSALELQPAPEAQPRSGTAKDTANGTALRRPRDDALPEHTRYRDRGCDLFASCLACPLPHCRYDVPGGARAMLNRVRDQEIRRLRTDAGLPVDEIAARFGLLASHRLPRASARSRRRRSHQRSQQQRSTERSREERSITMTNGTIAARPATPAERPLTQLLPGLDLDRLRRYREYLEYYDGRRGAPPRQGRDRVVNSTTRARSWRRALPTWSPSTARW